MLVQVHYRYNDKRIGGRFGKNIGQHEPPQTKLVGLVNGLDRLKDIAYTRQKERASRSQLTGSLDRWKASPSKQKGDSTAKDIEYLSHLTRLHCAQVESQRKSRDYQNEETFGTEKDHDERGMNYVGCEKTILAAQATYNSSRWLLRQSAPIRANWPNWPTFVPETENR